VGWVAWWFLSDRQRRRTDTSLSNNKAV
jgi:hypothetical protein